MHVHHVQPQLTSRCSAIEGQSLVTSAMTHHANNFLTDQSRESGDQNCQETFTHNSFFKAHKGSTYYCNPTPNNQTMNSTQSRLEMAPVSVSPVVSPPGEDQYHSEARLGSLPAIQFNTCSNRVNSNSFKFHVIQGQNITSSSLASRGRPITLPFLLPLHQLFRSPYKIING